MKRVRTALLLSFFALVCNFSAGQSVGTTFSFAPLDQWKNAVLSHDSAALTTFFSASPAPQISTPKGAGSVSSEAEFWTKLAARDLKLEIAQQQTPEAGVQVVVFQAEVVSSAPKSEVVYVTEAQAWQQQGDQWRLVVVKRTDPAHLKQPLDTNKNLYPQEANAREEIKEAASKATNEHKRVLLVFGANWCFDCHVLDLAFQRPDFAPVVQRYEVVHIDIGEEGKKNTDVAKQYDVPLEKGIPALAILDGSGKLLVSQKNGEFENARAMTPQAILEFLNKWKAEER